MAKTIKIGHAVGSEGAYYTDNNTGETIFGYRDGKPGDQTGKEVLIVDSYNIGTKYNIVLRPKTKALAEKSAKACEDACNNTHIG